MNFEHDEQPTNPTRNRPLSSILDAEISRRGALRGGALGAAGFMAAGAGAMSLTSAAGAQADAIVGNFEAIGTNSKTNQG